MSSPTPVLTRRATRRRGSRPPATCGPQLAQRGGLSRIRRSRGSQAPSSSPTSGTARSGRGRVSEPGRWAWLPMDEDSREVKPPGEGAVHAARGAGRQAEHHDVLTLATGHPAQARTLERSRSASQTLFRTCPACKRGWRGSLPNRIVPMVRTWFGLAFFETMLRCGGWRHPPPFSPGTRRKEGG